MPRALIPAALILLASGAAAAPSEDGVPPIPATEELVAPHTYQGGRCANFIFTSTGPSKSASVELADPITESRTRMVPRMIGKMVTMMPETYHVTTGYHRRGVKAEIVGRKPSLPWEREVVGVCLDGTRYRVSADGAYEYEVRENGDSIQLVPGAKRAMPPDPDGVAFREAWEYDRHLVLGFDDRWAARYGADEKTVIHLTLRRQKQLWPDSTVVDADYSFAPKASYQILVQPPRLPEGAYVATWSFRRVGPTSTGDPVERGKLPPIRLGP